MCCNNKHKEYDMRFKLYLLKINRQSGEVATAYIIGRSEEDAARLFAERDEAVGIAHEAFTAERVDHTLPHVQRDGLDALLETGPACFVSPTGIGWVGHVAPVRRLRLYCSHDHQDTEILALAPNVDVARALFANTLLPAAQRSHTLIIDDVTYRDAEEPCNGVRQLLDAGNVGIAAFDQENDGWFVW